MTTETETQPESFEEFEARSKAGEPVEVETPAEPNPEVNDKDDTLELTPDDEAVTDETDKDEKGKPRSKPAHQRIAEITKDKHDALRRAEAAEARLAALESGKQPEGQATETSPRPDPNDEKYEFGEHDPQYQEDLMDWKVEQRLAERDKKTAEEQRNAAITELATSMDAKWQEKATAGVELYPDFNEVVMESAAAQDWACPPLVALAISESDQGAHIAYHLATHKDEAKQLAELSFTDPMEAARRFGRLEARFEGKAKPEAKKITSAPEPTKHNLRGTGGRFEVGADTTDFQAFERKAKAESQR